MDTIVSCIVLGCKSCGAHGLISMITQLCSQTYKNIQIIPIACCIPERDLQMVEKLTGIGIKRVGHGDTYEKDNDGIQIATGKYLGFFAGDDLYEQTYLGKMVGALEQEEAGIAYCDFYSHYRIDGTVSPGQLEMGHITNGSFIMLSELAKKHEVPISQTGDIEFIKKCLTENPKTVHIPEALYIHI